MVDTKELWLYKKYRVAWNGVERVIENWGSLLVLSLSFLKFTMLWLLSFMELYMLWRKLKRWSLLMSDLNVILSLFVLCLLLRLVQWMFYNRSNTYLNYDEKIRFRVTHIFREGNAHANKLVNLEFIHRKSFHWYNRLLSSLFL